MGLHEEILSNKRKTYFLVFSFSLLLILVGYGFGLYFFNNGIFGMLFAFVIATIYSLIAFNSGDSMILASSHAKPVTKESDPQLMNIVEGLAIAAQIPIPKVYMINEESMNAFATGKDPEHASIAVTSGLRRRMSKLELEGVLAHEMSHIKNLDIKVMMIVTVLFGVVVLIADIIFYSFIFGGRRNNQSSGQGGIIVIAIGLALAILAPIVAQIIKFSVSRKREFLADSTGAKLTRYPKGLADALKKIKIDHDVVVDTANRATAHLYIENPLRNRKKWSSNIFATHPNIDERIRRLESM